MHRIAVLLSIVSYTFLSWLLPWLWSDRLDLAGGVAVLFASLVAFGTGTVALFAAAVSRDQQPVSNDRAGAGRPTGGAVFTASGLMVLGAAFLFGSYYDGLEANLLYFLIGFLCFGFGLVLLIATPRSRPQVRADRPGRRDPSVTLVLLLSGIALLASMPQFHYYPARRAIIVAEGILLIAISGARLRTASAQ